VASIGHVAVGMAASRVYHDGRSPGWRSMIAWSALSLLPDADVVGFSMGVEYGDPWGHRGATHSFTMAVAVGLIVAGVAASRARSFRRTAVIASALVASHGLLDSLTDGGLGAALLWPFSLVRYFAPWQPIPVAPIGLAFFTPFGATIALIELALFSPLFLFAFDRWKSLSRTATAAFWVFWFAAVWLTASTDPLRDSVLARVLREDRRTSAGFSEEAFSRISEGTAVEEVRRLLGAPFGEARFYQPKGEPFRPAMTRAVSSLPPDQCLAVVAEYGFVVFTRDAVACSQAGIDEGTSIGDVDRLVGRAPEWCWAYTWSPSESHFRLRALCFDHDKVSLVIRRWE